MPYGRETFLTGVCLLLLLVAAPGAVSAKDADAGAFLESLNREAHAKLADIELSQTQKEDNFRTMFRAAFDVPAISRFVLGRYWRKASEAQREDFINQFEELHMRRFLPLFADVSEKAIAVKRILPDENKPDFYKVASTVSRSEGEPISVVWRVRDIGDDYKVLDIVAEGVSMAISLRQEYGSVAKSHGIQGLIDMMREKNVELAAQQ